MSAHCSSPKCGAEIEWVETENGRPMPLDIGEFLDGNILVNPEGKAHVLTVAEIHEANGKYLYRRAHFTTCPARKEFRRGRRKK